MRCRLLLDTRRIRIATRISNQLPTFNHTISSSSSLSSLAVEAAFTAAVVVEEVATEVVEAAEAAFRIGVVMSSVVGEEVTEVVVEEGEVDTVAATGAAVLRDPNSFLIYVSRIRGLHC
jgi:hypothetical protein